MNANEIIKVLDEVTARISGPAEKVWEIYIRQMIAYGLADIVGAIMLLTAVIVSIKLLKKYEVNDEGMIFVSTMVMVGATIWAGALVISGTLFLVSPEFYALKEIIGGTK